MRDVLRTVGVHLRAAAVLVVCCAAVMRPGAAAGQYPLHRPGEPPFQDEADQAAPGAVASAAHTRSRVACDEVVARVDHDVGVQKGRSVNLAVVAKGLGTTKQWTAHCLMAYGRRISGSLEEPEDEDALEKLEEEEPEETAPEDAVEPGAHDRREASDENSQDRRELHVDNPLRPAPEKERVMRARPESPEEGNGFEGFRANGD